MKLGRGHPVRRTPDLTPMVDVIFLLIVFSWLLLVWSKIVVNRSIFRTSG